MISNTAGPWRGSAQARASCSARARPVAVDDEACSRRRLACIPGSARTNRIANPRGAAGRGVAPGQQLLPVAAPAAAGSGQRTPARSAPGRRRR
jgi:hypothetical protein